MCRPSWLSPGWFVAQMTGDRNKAHIELVFTDTETDKPYSPEDSCLLVGHALLPLLGIICSVTTVIEDNRKYYYSRCSHAVLDTIHTHTGSSYRYNDGMTLCRPTLHAAD